MVSSSSAFGRLSGGVKGFDRGQPKEQGSSEYSPEHGRASVSKGPTSSLEVVLRVARSRAPAPHAPGRPGMAGGVAGRTSDVAPGVSPLGFCARRSPPPSLHLRPGAQWQRLHPPSLGRQVQQTPDTLPVLVLLLLVLLLVLVLPVVLLVLLVLFLVLPVLPVLVLLLLLLLVRLVLALLLVVVVVPLVV